MAKVSPMEIYRLLPGTNCKECGEVSCMAFASALIERKRTIEDCHPLLDEKYRDKRKKLEAILTPPVKEIVIGSGSKAVKIGGEEVMYRHELTYFNPTALFFDVHDEMSSDEISERITRIDHFIITRIGQDLRLNGVAIRSRSGDPTKFGEVVLSVMERTDLPLAICALDPELLEIALEIAVDRRPLIYAATRDNWEKVGKLALDHKCPLVASSPGDMQGLLDLSQDLLDMGLSELVLDIGSYPLGDRYGQMLENLAALRRMAIERNLNLVGFPLIGVPMVAWQIEKDDVKASMMEATLAATQMLRYCDILILHSLETWSILPILTLRQNIYTDPRVPIQVDPGVYTIGNPDEESPVLMTTNFALTYYTVAADLEASKVDCHLIVVDTEGLAVEPAMAGGKLTASLVKDVIVSSKVKDLVKHRKIIIPGMAARISGEIEEATGWEVMVGPLDSSRIGGYLDQNWTVS
jgi:acetyl-CoA decarbonylase/synthase complex subunit gamma